MYLLLLNCTLKMVNFTLYIYFITVKKEKEKEWTGEGLDQITGLKRADSEL